MPDISITGVTLTRQGSYPSLEVIETVQPWEFLYKNDVGKYGLASAADDATDPENVIRRSNVTHISIDTGLVGEFVVCLPVGVAVGVLEGTALVQAQQYVLSVTPGKAALRSDLVSTNRLTTLFIGTDALAAMFNVRDTSITIP